MTDRERAFLLLQRVELFGSHSSALLSRESNFVRELARGVLRWRSRLDYIVSQLSDRPLSKIDQRALQILRMSLYELVFMQSAPYALVNEAVELTRRHSSRARGFVNAILRTATRTDLRSLLPQGSAERAAIELAHPQWLLARWAAQFGADRAMRIAAANQERSRPDLLVNTGAISLREAAALLARNRISFTSSPLVPRLLRLDGSSAALREETQAGLFHPMDEGSALVASLISPGARRVLDAAGAPGGKSLLMAITGHHVLTSDRSVARLITARRLFARFGISAQPIVAADAARPPFLRRFDAVLLDAPCSGTGTIRKHPEIKWRLDANCFAEFAGVQRTLLSGVLEFADQECIYATCSLEREENDEVVDDVLSRNQSFQLGDLNERLPADARRWVSSGVLRLTPESGADGFTAFLLRRKT